MRRRPDSTEYHEYYNRYVSLVPDGDILSILREQLESTLVFLSAIPGERYEHRYAPDKWSLQEVLRHVFDIEWVFTYRALHFARGETSPLPGVDQDALMMGVAPASYSKRNLIEEFLHLRTSNIVLFGTFDESILDRTGIASDCRFSVRSIPYIMAGHERHHIAVIRERYLSAGE
jgi:hypothetical protein